MRPPVDNNIAILLARSRHSSCRIRSSKYILLRSASQASSQIRLRSLVVIDLGVALTPAIRRKYTAHDRFSGWPFDNSSEGQLPARLIRPARRVSAPSLRARPRSRRSLRTTSKRHGSLRPRRSPRGATTSNRSSWIGHLRKVILMPSIRPSRLWPLRRRHLPSIRTSPTCLTFRLVSSMPVCPSMVHPPTARRSGKPVPDAISCPIFRPCQSVKCRAMGRAASTGARGL